MLADSSVKNHSKSSNFCLGKKLKFGKKLFPLINFKNIQSKMENVPLSGDDPQKRFGHTVTLISKTKAILFGGAISSDGNYKITGDTFLFDCTACTWSKIHPHYEEQRGPCPRAAHASTVVEELQMVVFGGAIGHGTLADDELYLLKNVDNGPGTWVKVPVESK